MAYTGHIVSEGQGWPRTPLSASVLSCIGRDMSCLLVLRPMPEGETFHSVSPALSIS